MFGRSFVKTDNREVPVAFIAEYNNLKTKEEVFTAAAIDLGTVSFSTAIAMQSA